MAQSSQKAKIPFLPLLEKLADSPFLYGVLSLLKRIYAHDIRLAGRLKEEGKTNISIYTMDDVFGGQRGDLGVNLCEHVSELLDKLLEFLLYATIHWFYFSNKLKIYSNARRHHVPCSLNLETRQYC